jgi:hypothetical protein
MSNSFSCVSAYVSWNLYPHTYVYTLHTYMHTVIFFCTPTRGLLVFFHTKASVVMYVMRRVGTSNSLARERESPMAAACEHLRKELLVTLA